MSLEDAIIIVFFIFLSVLYIIQDSRLAKLTKSKRQSTAFIPHVIVEGDTLWTLARAHHTTIDELIRCNPTKVKDGYIIKIDDILYIPHYDEPAN